MPISSFVYPNPSGVKSVMPVYALMDPNWQSYDDYYCRLYIEFEDTYRSGVFTDLDLDIRQRPGPSNGVQFDISRLLQAKLSFDRPSIAGTPSAVLATNVTHRYKVRLEEWKNGLLNGSETSDILHAYLAGFPFNDLQFMPAHINQYKFLTNQPATKEVTEFQLEFLYFIAPSTDTYTLKADLVHENDNTTAGYNPGISIAAEQYDVILFPVGFEQLGLNTINPGVVKWTVYLNDGLSESRVYELACQCSPLDRYYLMSNSLGGYDTVRTTGELAVKDDTQSQRIQKILGTNYVSSNRSFADIDTHIRETCNQHTGHLTKEENFWLKDLLLTEDAYRFGDYLPNLESTGRLVPIVIDRGSIPRYKDQDFLYGFPFSYKEAFESRGVYIK